ncbi:2-hydroxychromene-2-carboxylate isomerase [Bradyrhizobium sp.]|uniref:2-hydroxychromene-2-carboxylate isomerase n=1 Tax=Bradyrhizobium sp. TaxID=376 RepID=UPI002C512A4B|nr:2-hydroxychromene-2-carboxylate isomerase [Bradyrhizobium sp.]HMM92777.1 2-hydroxychromene-2-carboxylate isomerase [Bradyrhizobium sp.]
MSSAGALKVQFLFDFGSPNAYLAARLIPDIERRTGTKFAYVPVLLGGIYKLTGNSSPADYLKGIRNKGEYMTLETERFIRRHGITTFKRNPFFPVNTLQLMRGAVAAEAEGVFWPYFEAVFHHMWEEPRKMDDPGVMREALASSGIDVDRIVARSQDATVKNRLMALTQDAVDRGAFGSPTFFVNGEMFFGKDQLRDVEEEIVAQQGAAEAGRRAS